MRNKISGYTCVRNGVALDYCFTLTILSLLDVCDEVVVGYRESTDETLDLLETAQAMDPRVRIIRQPWNEPKGDINWWTRWINETREHLQYPVQLMLDADEVLDDSPACHAAIHMVADSGRCGWFRRLNFVRNAWTLIPNGCCCGEAVARLGPTQYWMPSDEPHPEGEPQIRSGRIDRPEMRIFHYGFIRKTHLLYNKIDEVNRFFFNATEDRLTEHKKTNAENWYEVTEWGHRLVGWAGIHPKVAIEWLRLRGRL